MTPVRPMPPAVAQKSSGSWSGPTSTTPAGVRRRSEWTCWAKEPSRWWFLPWTSAAMAPPTVTYRVPGDTGTNQPWGTTTRSRSSMLRPASAVTSPVRPSKASSRRTPVASATVPPAFWAASP